MALDKSSVSNYSDSHLLDGIFSVRLHMRSGGHRPFVQPARESAGEAFCFGVEMKTCRKCGGLFDGIQCKPCKQLAQTAFRAANPIRYREYAVAWAAKNKLRVKENKRRWREANRDKDRADKRERHIIKRALITSKLLVLQKGKCPCCGLPLGDDFHIDHIMPIALGGKNIESNMQLLRSACNQQKHAKHPIRFMQERGFLL